MSDLSELEVIEHQLREIQASQERYNYVGGAAALRNKLPHELKRWRGRARFFERIVSNLDIVIRITQAKEVLAKAEELYRTANKTEDMLNVVVNNSDVPAKEADTAIRGVVEDEQMLSSPLVQEGLVKLAISGGHFDVRRLAWGQVCRLHARNPPPSLRSSQGKFGAENLRRLRKSFIRERDTLGPRGTVTNSAELLPKGESLVTDLLAALANPVNVERKEAALTLGQIGGEEVAILLADALRSEIVEGSVDEEYQVYLASALSNLGGPGAVEGLLWAAEKGSERVRLAALSGLETLATAGAVALTEYPEPIVIEDEEMRQAYVELAKRLSDLISASTTPPYVRLRARELLETVQFSLNSTQLSTQNSY